MTIGQQETVIALLERSNRTDVPIRRSFVQLPVRGGGAGPLAGFVHDRRVRALDLYLLVHAVASAPPFKASFPAAVWVRALGLAANSSSETLVSRTWTWLEQHQLIESQRVGRKREITLLREDGSGDPYRHPGEQGAADRGHYFKLPYAYWEGNFHNRLSMPAKAILLIALSLQDDFILPTERGREWYGLSRDTVRKGLRDLRVPGLLTMREETKLAPLTALGYTKQRRYSLKVPFGVVASAAASPVSPRRTRKVAR
jgi:hypothetical protein